MRKRDKNKISVTEADKGKYGRKTEDTGEEKCDLLKGGVHFKTKQITNIF